MKKTIIFGAGGDGLAALRLLQSQGADALCFVDNFKHGGEIEGIKIISFEEMLGLYDFNKHSLLVASYNHREELVTQLKNCGIYMYEIYERGERPCVELNGDIKFYNYNELIQVFELGKYKNIAVFYGPKTRFFELREAFLSAGLLDRLKAFVSLDEPAADSYFGIPCVNIDKMAPSIDCLVIDARRQESTIDEYLLENENTRNYKAINFHDVDEAVCHNPKMEAFKNIHKGKRCFIAGNGPSLRMDDLTKLHSQNEISFGMNFVFTAFNSTPWRPTYYTYADTQLLSDGSIFADMRDEVEKVPAQKFINDHVKNPWGAKEPDGTIWMHSRWTYHQPGLPGFSSDVSRLIHGGFSSPYIAIQIAAYMGFSEIYLLGIDNGSGRKGLHRHFTEEYRQPMKSVFDFDLASLSYRKAEIVSRKRGFRIYNATRGGFLEEFERVDFDSLW